MGNLAKLIAESVEKHKDEIFLVDREIYRRREYSYETVYKKARALCGLFDSKGIKKGDKVVIYLPNSSDYVSLLWACALSGVIAVPVDSNFNFDFVQRIYRAVEAKLVFCSLFKSPDKVRRIYVEELSEVYDRFSEFNVKGNIEGEDVFEIIYTSGTTSEPKGVVIKHKNLYANIESARAIINKEIDGCSFLSILPLSHLFEQNLGLFLPMLYGCKIVYIYSRKSSSVIGVLNDEKIKAIVSVPLFLDAIKKKIEKTADASGKLSSLNNNLKRFENYPSFLKRVLYKRILSRFRYLEFFVVGGASLDVAVEKFWNSLGIRVLQGYGLSESSPILTCNSFDESKIGTVGKPIPNVEIKIVDGEIVAKGENIFSGYYENEVESEKILKGGWLYTGDFGEFDPDGFLKIVGRKKNMILSSSGLNVYPEDIERVLNNFPEARDSVVLGLDGGSRLVGVILSNGKVNLQELLKKANSKLEAHQYLNSIVVWKGNDFPRTPTMKIKRREVEAGIKLKQESGDSSDILIMLISEVCGISSKRIKEENYLRDFGLDSLRRIDLTVKIEERFDIDFNEDSIIDNTKVKDLRRLVKEVSGYKAESGLSFFNSKSFSFGRGVLQWIFFLLTKPIYSIKVEGLENLGELDKTGEPFILIANHSSMFDTLALLRALPLRYRKRMFVAGAKDYFFNRGSKYGRIIGIFGRVVLNAFAFSRDKDIKQSLKDFGSIINNGGSVIIYPEGTRSLDGKLHHFKQGIGLLTWHMNVPVLPVKLDKIYDVLPKGKVLPKHGDVKVMIGKPLKFNKMKSYSEITKILESKMRAL